MCLSIWLGLVWPSFHLSALNEPAAASAAASPALPVACLPCCLHSSLFCRQSNALSSLQQLGAGCGKNQAQLAPSDSRSPAGTVPTVVMGHTGSTQSGQLSWDSQTKHVRSKEPLCSKFDFSISHRQLGAFPIWGLIQGVGCSQC